MSIVSKEKRSELLSFIESNKLRIKVSFPVGHIIIRKKFYNPNNGFRKVMDWIGMHYIVADSEFKKPKNGNQTIVLKIKCER